MPKGESMNALGCDVVCELLEMAVHTILYVRDVYPAHLFEKRKKYGIPVQVSRHPQLTAYIADVICQIRLWMEKGMLYNVLVTIFDKVGVAFHSFIVHYFHLIFD
eukprot:m.40475 g.40475  ORF g.40475 m.40475 type:complete len:105 (+) comp6929_c3_seq2:160-474(+)